MMLPPRHGRSYSAISVEGCVERPAQRCAWRGCLAAHRPGYGPKARQILGRAQRQRVKPAKGGFYGAYCRTVT
jgi:hypothetical protein